MLVNTVLPVSVQLTRDAVAPSCTVTARHPSKCATIESACMTLVGLCTIFMLLKVLFYHSSSAFETTQATKYCLTMNLLYKMDETTWAYSSKLEVAKKGRNSSISTMMPPQAYVP